MSFDKNKPQELKDLYDCYLNEIRRDLMEQWANREKILMDIKILKPWYPQGWQTATNESITNRALAYFNKEMMINGVHHVFAQLLTAKVKFI